MRRGKRMSDIDKAIVESAKMEILTHNLTGRLDSIKPLTFLNSVDDVTHIPKKLERSPAIYANIPIRKAE
jgi:hypothetical protein